MERRMTGNCHVRCGAGENPEITSKDYLSLLGQVPDFDKVIAFVRSMGMSLNVIIQNLAQLKARYEKTWEVITGNCDSTIFLGGKEETTLKSISEQLGKETIDVKGQNRTKGKQSSTSENNSILGRELMQQNELATMPISDCIVMIRSKDPVYAAKYPAFDHPNFRFSGLSDDDNRADIRQIHSVTVAEFEAEQKAKRAEVIRQIREAAAAEKPVEKPDEVLYTAQIPVVTAEEIPTSYEDILDMDSEISSVADSEIYADNTHYYGIPDDEIESRDMGEAIRNREEEYEDEETEIAPAVIDEDGELSIPAESDEFEIDIQYGDPEENPEQIVDLTHSDVKVRILTTAEELPDVTEGIGDPSILGHTFND